MWCWLRCRRRLFRIRLFWNRISSGSLNNSNMCLIFQCLQRKLLSTLQPEGSTPLKWGIATALFCSIFGYAVALQMLFAFLPDMVKSFGIADEDAGYYVGLLASSVFLGRFLSSYFWGWLCDKIGRRKVLLWCLSLIAILTLSFGFVKSFAMAFVVRLSTGLVAGVGGTAKAIIVEICDETNQALGMSMVVAAWNSGLILGPAVGGYLARPVDKYPLFTKGSLFDNYAYLLPCLVNTGILLFSILLTYFKIPETLMSLKEKTAEGSLPLSQKNCQETSHGESDTTAVDRQSLSKDVNNLASVSCPKKGGNAVIEMNAPVKIGCDSGSVSFLPEVHLYDFAHGSKTLGETPKTDTKPYVLSSTPKPGMYGKVVQYVASSKLFTLCKNRNVRYSIGLYTVFSYASISEHEMYSIWAASGKNLGGLDFDTNDLGFTLMVVGIGTTISGFVLFPRLVKWFGQMKTQFLMLYANIFFVIILPALNILYLRRTSLTVTVIAVLLALRIAQGCCFAGQFLFIGNSVDSRYRATVHGLAMTMTCLARSIAPVVSGSIFSWSVTSGLGFPFNEKCVFIFLGFVFFLSVVIACCLDVESVSKRSD